ncbi:MAG: glycogen synthase GlgA [Vicinamibacterales bacterium]
MPTDSRLVVLMLSSEAVPFSKTGGLGDVAGALPPALARRGHEVTLVVPRYRGCQGGSERDCFAVTVGATTHVAGFLACPLDSGAEAILVDCPPLFDREGLYGEGGRDYPDNDLRFAFLTVAALEFVRRSGRRPDVVHAHDWQTGLAAAYLRTRYRDDPVLRGVPVVFSVHNLAYQGLFPPQSVPALDLPWELYSIDGFEFWGRMSFLKAGIQFSQVITTVSRRYALEIQTPEYGFGFEGLLRHRAGHLVGILNGIDVDRWDPRTDPYLPVPYGPGNLGGKEAAKRLLLEACRMPADDEALALPLVGLVSRMVDQKGFDLLASAADALLKTRARFVLLGTGERRYEDLWRDLASRHPDRVATVIGFDNRLAHLIEGGADIFLMPSRFEPCGLNQMYSMRYGTVPVVRATGGLDDTVRQWSRAGGGTGFKFHEYTPTAMMRALRAALAAYGSRDDWRRIMEAGMAQDFSWDASAGEYVRVYDRAIRQSRA